MQVLKFANFGYHLLKNLDYIRALFSFIYLFIYLFISDPKASIYAHTRKKKKKRKRNINPKRCTIEKYKFKTKFAQNISNKTIYTISPMTLMR